MKDSLACCSCCGSLKVQTTAWVFVNSGKDAGGDSPTGQDYCSRCDDETSICWIFKRECGWTFGLHDDPKSIRTIIRQIRKDSGWENPKRVG